MARYFNIAVAVSATNNDIILTITECTQAGASTPAANYSFKKFRNPGIRYQKAGVSGDAFFQITSNGADDSVSLTFDNVVNLDGVAHGHATTVALANAVAALIIA